MTGMTIQTPAGCVWLAQRNNFLVYGDQDYLYVKHSDGRIWDVGGMYGNAVAALITWDERYAVIVGCGIVICDLKRFGENVGNGRTWKTTPVIHLMEDPGDRWWFALIEQILYDDDDRIEIRVATDLTDSHVGIYSLNPRTFEFRPVPHCEPMP